MHISHTVHSNYKLKGAAYIKPICATACLKTSNLRIFDVLKNTNDYIEKKLSSSTGVFEPRFSLLLLLRVYLLYHTWSQVFYGGVAGCTIGIVWFFFTQEVLTPLFPKIAAW